MKWFFAIILCVFVIIQGSQAATNLQNGNGSYKKLYEIIPNGSLQDVDELLKNGANVNFNHQQGDGSPLHTAVIAEKVDIVEMLLKNGANIQAKDRFLRSPLMMAAYGGNVNIVKILIDKGATIDDRSIQFDTALMYASAQGNLNVSKLLINNGADVNAVNNRSDTSLMFACSRGHAKLAELLVKNGANLQMSNRFGYTPLHMSSENGYADVVEVLLDYGANIDAQDPRTNQTALHRAIDRDQDEVIQLLIDRSSDINLKKKGGWAPLHMACQRGYDHVAELLIRSGADINSQTSRGLTPLFVAALNGREKVVDVLIKMNADPEILSSSGISPLDAATHEGFIRIIKLLQNVPRVTQRACASYANLPVERVLGGELVEDGEFPWMAALGYLNENTGEIDYRCGGTIISEYFILTAAHCTKRPRIPVVVRLGKVSLKDDDGFAPINRQVEEIIRHKSYSAIRKSNDIALIRVGERITFFNDIMPACLQTDARDESADVKLTVTGWGRYSIEHKKTSTELLKTQLQTMPLSECNATLMVYNQRARDPALEFGVKATQYCAYDPMGRNDSCQGDSGGPLQLAPRDSWEVATIVGIVSYGINCGTGLPALYTRVASYLDWVESHVWPRGVSSASSFI